MIARTRGPVDTASLESLPMLHAHHCAATGKHEVVDYMAEYETFVRSFEEVNKPKPGGMRQVPITAF